MCKRARNPKAHWSEQYSTAEGCVVSLCVGETMLLWWRELLRLMYERIKITIINEFITYSIIIWKEQYKNVGCK